MKSVSANVNITGAITPTILMLLGTKETRNKSIRSRTPAIFFVTESGPHIEKDHIISKKELKLPQLASGNKKTTAALLAVGSRQSTRYVCPSRVCGD